MLQLMNSFCCVRLIEFAGSDDKAQVTHTSDSSKSDLAAQNVRLMVGKVPGSPFCLFRRHDCFSHLDYPRVDGDGLTNCSKKLLANNGVEESDRIRAISSFVFIPYQFEAGRHPGP